MHEKNHVITFIIICLGIHLIMNQGDCYKALTPSKSMLIAQWMPIQIIIMWGNIHGDKTQ